MQVKKHSNPMMLPQPFFSLPALIAAPLAVNGQAVTQAPPHVSAMDPEATPKPADET
jgi:hypothetical protein